MKYLTPQYTPAPTKVAGVSQHTLDLNGTWKFTEKAPEALAYETNFDTWKDIQVPGEWFMQGFDVAEEEAAGYARSFEVPADWAGRRIKLLFDGVYSDCRVYLNGIELGGHVGGFTPFEIDVTEAVRIGERNVVSLSVKNDSLADSLASGSSYACHPLGGIPRNVSLFAVPEAHVSDLTLQTSLDDTFCDAELTVKMTLRNQSQETVGTVRVECEVKEVGAEESVLCTLEGSLSSLVSGAEEELVLSANVSKPRLWHCEHPHLHLCTTEILVNNRPVQTLDTRFGFRQVDVVGNELRVNGQPVMLRGVNRHEVHPLQGRAYVPGLARQDVLLFREANVNHIRTCHYPPSRELLEVCDELGMFLEVEAPFCWAHKTEAPMEEVIPATVRPNLEMVQRDKNHASVILWSIGNESFWNEAFEAAAKAVAELDPSRPRTFNYYPWGGKHHFADAPTCPVASDHYPGYHGALKFENYHRPVSFGEYGHLNAYNRFELATDQGLRDRWGEFFHPMWEGMYQTRGCIGGSIWAGIDDSFLTRGMTLGYGVWGPIDGWRRPKPEYWAVKKTYAPVQLVSVEQGDSSFTLVLENRQDASNLSGLKMHWTCGTASGDLQADAPPKGQAEVEIPVVPAPDAPLRLTVLDPRGFMVNDFVVEAEAPAEDLRGDVDFHLKDTEDTLILEGGRFCYEIDKTTGRFRNLTLGESTVSVEGPHLMLLPMNEDNAGGTRMELQHQPVRPTPFTDSCTEWILSELHVREGEEGHEIYVAGTYKEAEGVFIYRFLKDGSFTVTSDFWLREDLSPRQMGVVFDLPAGFDTLSWHRDGQWDSYPEWHIGRTRGTARAGEGVDVTLFGPTQPPEHEWRHDRTQLGSYDFTSTKHRIREASLRNEAGVGLRTVADGDRHVRAWIQGDTHRLLIAHYSNGGGERFLRALTQHEDIHLRKEGRVFAVDRFELCGE